MTAHGPRQAAADAAAVHLEWSTLCAALVEHLVSPVMHLRVGQGGQIDPRAALPLTLEPSEAQRWLDEVDAVAVLTQTEGGRLLGAALERVAPIEALLIRASRGAALDLDEVATVAEVVEAAAMTSSLAAAAEIDEQTRRVVCSLTGPIAVSPELVEILARSVTRVEGTGALLDTASAALGSLRRHAEQAKRALRSAADRMIARSDLADALSDRYWTEREGRVVLPVRSDGFARHGAPGKIAGIIHDASGSGRTLFVEPHALIEAGNAVRQAQMAVQAEERRVLAALRDAIGAEATALAACVEALARLDHVRARLLLSRRLEGIRPQIGFPGQDLGRIELRGVRHPSMLLRGDHVIPNDLTLGVGQALVISGPNAGGKTVALKSLGLCVMMAQAGLYLPTATPAAVPLFRTIVTDVGDDQSIAASLSTFSAHIGHLAAALEHAQRDGAGTLVLLDEVAGGTDPEQGAALAEAVLERLAELGATVVVTTHYERLKLLASRAPERFVNAAVGFDLDELRPTFRLSKGTPGSSSAIAVARRLGLSPIVLERAEGLLSDEGLRVDVLLRELEAERERLHRTRSELEREREQLRDAQARLDARETGKLETATRRRVKAVEAATAELRALEDEIRRRRKALRQIAPEPPAGGRPSDAEARAFSREARERLLAQRLPAPSDAPRETVETLDKGMHVRVESFGKAGDVLGFKGDRVIVQLAGAKVTVSRNDVRRIDGPGKPRPQVSVVPQAAVSSAAARHFGSDAQPVREGIDNVVNLRGTREQEALTMLEVFLDRAIADDRELVIVKHGHGSGALRKAVRDHLPHLRHVARWRPGLPAEGGDAVTVVWVRG